MKSLIQLFEDKKIRTLFDEEKQEWFFSVVDVCGALSETSRAAKYWNDLKAKLKTEKNQLSDKIGRLKMPAPDGKMRETDVLCTKDILRLVQEIPSKKAKQFRIWIAKVAVEKIAEKRQARIAAAEETKMIAVKARKKNKAKMILWGLGVFGVLVGAVVLVVVLI